MLGESMKKVLYVAITLAIACSAAIATYGFMYWRVRMHTWSEAERHWVSHELAVKTESLRLIRSGKTQEGLQLLDHSLDVEILIAAGRSPLPWPYSHLPVQRSEAVHSLKPVAAYRAVYPRLPYDCKDCTGSPEDADKALKDFGTE